MDKTSIFNNAYCDDSILETSAIQPSTPVKRKILNQAGEGSPAPKTPRTPIRTKRCYSIEYKLNVVEETKSQPTNVIARSHGLNTSTVRLWRGQEHSSQTELLPFRHNNISRSVKNTYEKHIKYSCYR